MCECQESEGVGLFARVETLRQVLKVIVQTTVIKVSEKIPDRCRRDLGNRAGIAALFLEPGGFAGCSDAALRPLLHLPSSAA